MAQKRPELVPAEAMTNGAAWGYEPGRDSHCGRIKRNAPSVIGFNRVEGILEFTRY
jgi:hypothetical protein